MFTRSSAHTSIPLNRRANLHWIDDFLASGLPQFQSHPKINFPCAVTSTTDAVTVSILAFTLLFFPFKSFFAAHPQKRMMHTNPLANDDIYSNCAPLLIVISPSSLYTSCLFAWRCLNPKISQVKIEIYVKKWKKSESDRIWNWKKKQANI